MCPFSALALFVLTHTVAIYTFTCMGNYVYPNRQGLPHMHCLKETTDEEENSSPSLETSHAMSLYI